MFTASDEFGFGKNNEPTSAAPQPTTTLAGVEQSAAGAWHSHPGIALFGLLALTAVALERTTKPVASARVGGSLGPAKAGIEGEI